MKKSQYKNYAIVI